MKTVVRTLNTILTVFLVAVITSCGSGGKKAIGGLEKCLGNMKTLEDGKNITKEQSIVIAKCMLPQLDELKAKVEKMSESERVSFQKEVLDATNKSEYKEILNEMNYERVKTLANGTE
jgi:hypothetical protein